MNCKRSSTLESFIVKVTCFRVERLRQQVGRLKNFKEDVSLHSQQKVRFREYFEYFIMG